LSLAACASTEPPIDTKASNLTVQVAAPEFGYQIASEPLAIEPGQEIYFCTIGQLRPQDGEFVTWINEFRMRSSEGTHHLTTHMGTEWTFADACLGAGNSEAILGGEFGPYDCKDLGNIMETSLPILPSQNTRQSLQFPE